MLLLGGIISISKKGKILIHSLVKDGKRAFICQREKKSEIYRLQIARERSYEIDIEREIERQRSRDKDREKEIER